MRVASPSPRIFLMALNIPHDNTPEMIDAEEAERVARLNGGSALVNTRTGAARFFVVTPDKFREMEAVNRLAGHTHSSPMLAKKETRKQRKLRAASRKRDEERKARELKTRRRRAQELHISRKKAGKVTSPLSAYFT